MVVEQMNETPNLLIQLGEALWGGGLFVVLLFLCGGTVWVVMSVRSNKVDHERLETKIDKGLERLEGKVETLRKEAREDAKETREQLRSINTRLDGIIGQKPPDPPG